LYQVVAGCSRQYRGYNRHDLNWDGAIDDADLLQVLFAFGQGC